MQYIKMIWSVFPAWGQWALFALEMLIALKQKKKKAITS